MTDLQHLLEWIFIIFTAVCLLFCLEAWIRYHRKRGIDQQQGFDHHYEYFVQPVYDHANKLFGYELLLREFNQTTKSWQLPPAVTDFPLNKAVATIKKMLPQLKTNLSALFINLTVRQMTDFRAKYFFKWVQGLVMSADIIIELDSLDLQTATRWQQFKLRYLLKQLDHTKVKVTIENVDSSQKTYFLLQPYLPYLDYLKFDMASFHKSTTHWIDITLAQWQRRAKRYQIIPIISKVEHSTEVALADQLAIKLRQGYHYGPPTKLLKHQS